MKKLLALFVGAVAVMYFAAPALATPDPDGDGHKVGICHRTASDTNPYVYIEVDEAAADEIGGHLGNTDPGHKPTFWKSDGTFRGVDHVDGDPKDDYLAESKADCKDFDDPEEPVEVSASVTFLDPTCRRRYALLKTGEEDGLNYFLEGEVGPGNEVRVTVEADQGYLLVGTSVFTHTFGEVPEDCDNTPPPPPNDPPKFNPPGNLAETGWSTEATIAAGLAALFALLGTVALRASRYVKGGREEV